MIGQSRSHALNLTGANLEAAYTTVMRMIPAQAPRLL